MKKLITFLLGLLALVLVTTGCTVTALRPGTDERYECRVELHSVTCTGPPTTAPPLTPPPTAPLGGPEPGTVTTQ